MYEEKKLNKELKFWFGENFEVLILFIMMIFTTLPISNFGILRILAFRMQIFRYR
ncbi:hypothetical protein U3516DRAFT_740794 [Neocallimastix sp. 'constans']